MSFAKDIIDIFKDISSARKNYKKTQAKDKYIDEMEDQLDRAMEIITSLNEKLDYYSKEPTLSLDDIHLQVLRKIKESDNYSIGQYYMEHDSSDELLLALAELQKHKYVEIHYPYGSSRAHCYRFTESHKAEILRELLKQTGTSKSIE